MLHDATAAASPLGASLPQRSSKLDERAEDAASSYVDMRKIITFIGAAYFLVVTVFIVPFACIFTCVFFIYPFWLFSRQLFNRLEHRLCQFVNDHWVATSQQVGMTVVESGDDIHKYADRRCLLLANHVALLDHFVIMTAVHDKKSVPGRYLWVIYNIWKYTPLGAMWTLHGNFFVNGGAAQKAKLLGEFRKHLQRLFWRHDYGWIVMYPEGSRLYLVKESGAKFAEKQGMAPLKNCIYPRTGAAHAVMEVCAPISENEAVTVDSQQPIEYVIDVTLGYPKGDAADLYTVMTGDWKPGQSEIHIHYKVHPMRAEFRDEKKLQDWLYHIYKEKDTLLEGFLKRGYFPNSKRKAMKISTLRMLGTQVFWWSAFFAHYYLWFRPLTASISDYFASFF